MKDGTEGGTMGAEQNDGKIIVPKAEQSAKSVVHRIVQHYRSTLNNTITTTYKDYRTMEQ